MIDEVVLVVLSSVSSEVPVVSVDTRPLVPLICDEMELVIEDTPEEASELRKDEMLLALDTPEDIEDSSLSRLSVADETSLLTRSETLEETSESSSDAALIVELLTNALLGRINLALEIPLLAVVDMADDTEESSPDTLEDIDKSSLSILSDTIGDDVPLTRSEGVEATDERMVEYEETGVERIDSRADEERILDGKNAEETRESVNADLTNMLGPTSPRSPLGSTIPVSISANEPFVTSMKL